MSMTVSMFDTYFTMMPLVRAQRMMDGAQSALYAQVTQEGKNKMWNNWTNIMTRIRNHIRMQDASIRGKSTITINGEETSVDGLRQWFRSMFGKRSVEGKR
jgi:hypothetical protein